MPDRIKSTITKLVLLLFAKHICTDFFNLCNGLYRRFCFHIQKITAPIRCKTHSLLNNFIPHRTTRQHCGQIAILLAFATPALIYGVKYIVENSIISSWKIFKKQNDLVYKECARSVAHEVAKNWNPGLSLSAQKDALLKIADTAYNLHPEHFSGIIGKAISGLERTDTFVRGSTKSVSSTSMNSKINRVLYMEDQVSFNSYICTFPASANPYFLMYRTADSIAETIKPYVAVKTEPNGKISIQKFDTFIDPSSISSGTTLTSPFVYLDAKDYPNSEYPTVEKFHSSDALGWFMMKSTDAEQLAGTAISFGATDCKMTGDKISKIFFTRMNMDDTKVQVSLEKDGKIKVIAEADIAYSVPAKCNIDIILSIPTNAAACNENNLDYSLVTSDNRAIAEPCFMDISGNTAKSKKTPIYQIAQAYRRFLKDNFINTQGVNVGLIPYSGKVSISPSRVGWTTPFQAFFTDYFVNDIGTYPRKHKPLLRGSVLYGTSGIADAKLRQTSSNEKDIFATYKYDTKLNGVPIMFRRGGKYEKTDDEDATIVCGGNPVFCGDILSNEAPATDALKFHQMNLNPCYLGYANLLGMKCEKTCLTYQPNPYYIIELTPNVEKVCELLNVIYPFYDSKNVSSFSFIPISWANNLLMPWTSCSEDCKASEENLFRESKLSEKRKKAIILIVNKPDCFEPGELTYLGFNNDYSELQLTESDKIDFRIDYSGSYKYGDDQNYSGEFYGYKRIIKFSSSSFSRSNGYYECNNNGTGSLTFPEKGQIKLVVETISNINSLIFAFSPPQIQIMLKTTTGSTEMTQYTIRNRETIYIEPYQIPDKKDGYHTISFSNMRYLRLISVEISNAEVSPRISWSGGNVIKSYNGKGPFKMTVKAPQATATFTSMKDSDNNNTVSENLKSNILTYGIAKNFVFNSKHEKFDWYCPTRGRQPYNKFSYSLANAKVKSCEVKNRKIRWKGGIYEWYDDGIYFSAFYNRMTPDSRVMYTNRWYESVKWFKVLWWWVYRTVEHLDKGYITWYLPEKRTWSVEMYCKPIEYSIFHFYFFYWYWSYHSKDNNIRYSSNNVTGKTLSCTLAGSKNTFSISGNYLKVYQNGVNTYGDEIFYVIFSDQDKFTPSFGKTSGTIGFYGTGDITMEVEPDARPYLEMKKVGGSMETTLFTDKDFSENKGIKTIIVDQDTYEYEKNEADNSFEVRVTLSNATITSVEALDSSSFLRVKAGEAPPRIDWEGGDTFISRGEKTPFVITVAPLKVSFIKFKSCSESIDSQNYNNGAASSSNTEENYSPIDDVNYKKFDELICDANKNAIIDIDSEDYKKNIYFDYLDPKNVESKKFILYTKHDESIFNFQYSKNNPSKPSGQPYNKLSYILSYAKMKFTVKNRKIRWRGGECKMNSDDEGQLGWKDEGVETSDSMCLFKDIVTTTSDDEKKETFYDTCQIRTTVRNESSSQEIEGSDENMTEEEKKAAEEKHKEEIAKTEFCRGRFVFNFQEPSSGKIELKWKNNGIEAANTDIGLEGSDGRLRYETTNLVPAGESEADKKAYKDALNLFLGDEENKPDDTQTSGETPPSEGNEGDEGTTKETALEIPARLMKADEDKSRGTSLGGSQHAIISTINIVNQNLLNVFQQDRYTLGHDFYYMIFTAGSDLVSSEQNDDGTNEAGTGGNIGYYGTGDTEIEVIPMERPYIELEKYKTRGKPSDGKEIEKLEILTPKDTITLTIDPDEYYYAPQGNDFVVKVNLSNAKVARLEVLSEALRHPEKLTYTRRFDWHKDVPDSNTVGPDLGYVSGSNKFDRVSNATYANTSNNNVKMEALNYPGDATLAYEETAAAKQGLVGGDIKYETYTPGLVRKFFQLLRNSIYKYISTYTVGETKTTNVIFNEFTYPINAVLLFGYGDGMNYRYKWQKPDGNTDHANQALALRRVVTDACKKLKTDHKEAKIYVIKYRAQETSPKLQFYHGIEDSDYSAINSCATDGGAIYNANSEDSLQEALQKIADDIKTNAGYEDAKCILH